MADEKSIREQIIKILTEEGTLLDQVDALERLIDDETDRARRMVE
jgi:hypothetical protein